MANNRSSRGKAPASDRAGEIKRQELKRKITILVITVIVGIFLFLANFGIIGTIGDAVSGFFFGLFGTLWYVLPPVIIIETFVVLIRPHSRSRTLHLVGAFLLYFGLAFVFALAQSHSAEKVPFTQCYALGLNENKGGIFSLFFCSLIVSLLGKVGTWIFAIILVLAGAISVIGFGNITEMADNIKNWAGSEERQERLEYRRMMREQELALDDERRRNERARRLEEEQEKVLRMQNKAVGVQFAGTNLKEQQAEAENIQYQQPVNVRMPAGEEIQPQNGVFADNLGLHNIPKPPVPLKDTDDLQEVTEDTYFSGKSRLDAGSDGFAPGAMAGSDMPYQVDDMAPVAKRSVIPVNFGGIVPNNSIKTDSDGITYESPEEKFRREQAEKRKKERFESELAKDVRGMMDESEDAFYPSPEPIQPEPSAPVKESPGPSKGMQEITPVAAAPIEKAPVQAPPKREERPQKKSSYKFPTVDLLDKPRAKSGKVSNSELADTAEKLEITLRNFGVDAKVTDVTRGPSVTRFEIEPAVGVKVSKIVNLSDDIKLNLAAPDIRIEAPIPGKSAVGIEVPNKESTPVTFREMIECRELKDSKSRIAFGAGRDIAGAPVISDIAKMPHLLIAGATGSGKSVCINTIIMSILFRARPNEVKLIMIDPKVVELSVYNGIPHLMLPVVTDPKKAAAVLQSAVVEMTKRYNLFAEKGVRDLAGYNEAMAMDHVEPLPQIVIIVDELADLMMVASKEVEESICRLAQLARACGMHLIIATQRPSVNVITGLIKANMPSRIAFAVTSGIDSRTILDMYGAEKLLGKGDMLYSPQNLNKPLRAQGAFVSDDEVRRVVDFLKQHNEPAEADEEMSRMVEEAQSKSIAIDGNGGGGDMGDEIDPYLAEAGHLIIEKERASIGFLQRNFKIGFNRAARIMDQLCANGVVGPEEGTKPRQLLMTLEEFDEFVAGGNLR